jgi:hypothetical protein
MRLQLTRGAYLAAIVFATAGWLWLILFGLGWAFGL